MLEKSLSGGDQSGSPDLQQSKQFLPQKQILNELNDSDSISSAVFEKMLRTNAINKAMLHELATEASNVQPVEKRVKGSGSVHSAHF